MPATTRPLEAQVIVRLAEAGGRAVERKITLPVVAAGNMIGVKPLFSGRSLGEGETATLRRRAGRARRQARSPRSGLRYELLKIESRYQWYRRDGRWDYEPIKPTRRVADGRLDVAADQPGRIAAPVQWGRYRLEVSTGEPDGPVTSVGFDAGWYTEATRRHAGPAGDRARQAGIPAGRDHDGRGHRAHRRPRHAQRDGRQAARLA